MRALTSTYGGQLAAKGTNGRRKPLFIDTTRTIGSYPYGLTTAYETLRINSAAAWSS